MKPFSCRLPCTQKRKEKEEGIGLRLPIWGQAGTFPTAKNPRRIKWAPRGKVALRVVGPLLLYKKIETASLLEHSTRSTHHMSLVQLLWVGPLPSKSGVGNASLASPQNIARSRLGV